MRTCDIWVLWASLCARTLQRHAVRRTMRHSTARLQLPQPALGSGRSLSHGHPSDEPGKPLARKTQGKNLASKTNGEAERRGVDNKRSQAASTFAMGPASAKSTRSFSMSTFAGRLPTKIARRPAGTGRRGNKAQRKRAPIAAHQRAVGQSTSLAPGDRLRSGTSAAGVAAGPGQQRGTWQEM